MPEFNTWIDVDVDEFWQECSTSEKEDLIDVIVEDGWALRASPKGSNPKDSLPSIPELEWQEMVNKLSSIRNIIRLEDEEILWQITKKY